MILGKAYPFTLPSAKATPAQPSPVPGAANSRCACFTTQVVTAVYMCSAQRRTLCAHTHTPHLLTHTRGSSILDCAVL